MNYKNPESKYLSPLCYKVKKTFKVYGDDKDASIEVGDDHDDIGLIEISTTDEYSRKYYGEFRIGLTKELAKLLGETLIKAANENEK